MGYNRSGNAVTEVLSTVILLVIAVAVFASGALIIFNPAVSSENVEDFPLVTIVGTIEGEDIVFYHRGGDALSADSVEVTYTINGAPNTYIITNNISETPPDNSQWNIGERVVFEDKVTQGDKVEVDVVDLESGTLIMTGVLQTGHENDPAAVITTDATEITTTSARLNMDYNFNDKGYPNSYRANFQYRESGSTSWIDLYSANWPQVGGSGSFDNLVSNLEIYIDYEFRAQIKYTDLFGSVNTTNGTIAHFTTLNDKVGLWHFENNAQDSSGYENHGTVHGAEYKTGVAGGDALEFDGAGDYVEVGSSDSLNLISKISIEAWVKPVADSSVGFTGEIKEVRESNILDFFYEPDIIHIADEDYVIAYRNKFYDGFLKKVAIKADGQIGGEIKTYKFTKLMDDVVEPDIIKFNDNIYVVVWGTPDGDKVIVATVDINAGMGMKTSKVFSSEYCGIEPNIIHIGGTTEQKIYAISCGGDIDRGGQLMTIAIKKDLSITKKAERLFEEELCTGTDIIQIKEDIYAVVYGGGSNIESAFPSHEQVDDEKVAKAYLKTFKIDESGSIENLDSKSFSLSYLAEPDIIHVKGSANHYAIVYGGQVGGTGFIKTISIDIDGTIQGQIIGYYPFDDNCVEPCIVNVEKTIYAIAYGKGCNYNKGFVKTIEIHSNGNVGEILDTESFDKKQVFTGNIIPIGKGNDNRFVIVYGWGDCTPGNPDYKGFISTIRIHMTNNRKIVIAKGGAYELKATDSSIFAYMNGNQLLSADMTTGAWNFIVLTYDSAASTNNIKLYVKGIVQGQKVYSQNIIANANDLIIGGLKSTIDEVVIYNRVLSQSEITTHYATV